MKENRYLESKGYLTEHYKNLDDFKFDFRNQNLVTLIESFVSGRKVLDIGCANGVLINMLAKKGLTVYGIEPNKDLVNQAKAINPDINIIEGYADSINKVKEKMDTITIIDVLEHIDDDEEQIRLMYESLRPGGRLVVVVPCFKVLYGKRDVALGHYRRYTRTELETKLGKCGFLVKKTRYWNALGFFPYLISEKILRKKLNTNLRTRKSKRNLLRLLLNFWFKYVENNFNFGFGLSLICIAQKK